MFLKRDWLDVARLHVQLQSQSGQASSNQINRPKRRPANAPPSDPAANEIISLNRAGASGRTGLAPQQLGPAQPACARASTSPLISCRITHVHALDLLRRKPRINSQLVAQQVAQQYPMPPPPKKERRERSDRTDKERADGEGERAHGEGRPEVDRPERVRAEGDTPEKEKCDKEQPIQEKHGTEKDISPAITKKPGSKKTRSDPRSV